MIRLAPDRRKTLELVQQVSLAGRGDVTPTALLQEVCRAVSDAFDFDRVAALRFDPAAEEVSEIAFAGVPSVDPDKRRPLASVPLLAEARETQSLALVFDGEVEDATSAFALPLISAERCLGFLSGNCRGITASRGGEVDALSTVGVVTATLLENALARQETQQLDVLKSEFIALAAHELRNPLSSVYGIFVTLEARGDSLAEPERRALRDGLREQMTRTRNLIEQLLDLSRFDLAAIQFAPEPLRLRPKIEKLVRTLVAGRPDVVRIGVPADLEVVVDPTALDRILSNLVTNALRHGEPPVTVTAARRDTHLRLAVEDRGEGVRREFIPRLFDRFARSSESRSRTEGSGLGLAIAQAYARAHGGDIIYEPAVPHGARFEVVIPLHRAERGELEPSKLRLQRRHSPGWAVGAENSIGS
jgi:signal transduction histidine kinase